MSLTQCQQYAAATLEVLPSQTPLSTDASTPCDRQTDIHQYVTDRQADILTHYYTISLTC